MRYPYLVIDNSADEIQETIRVIERFPDYFCVGTADSKDDAINLILELQPKIVFLGLSTSAKSETSLAIVTDLYMYLNQLPCIVIIADTPKFAFDGVKAGVSDYLLRPLINSEVVKTLLKFSKQFSSATQESNIQEKNSTNLNNFNSDINKEESNPLICIRSYGDYQFISVSDIVYLKADNNSTDFFLNTGRKLTAYKTLKHYENNLEGSFYRIHNSYIINSNYVTRISTGKSLCYLNGNEISVPFSKTFKENIDTIIRNISPEYL
ncbi:MAG: DNA-binding response regulator [Pedobacter sp.]|nr:MAG: DNA-binding response regulator [Pedobacter sp.]